MGVLSGFAVSSVFLCIFAFVFVGLKTIPQEAVSLFSLISAGLGAFSGGYVAVKFTKEKGMFFGMLVGFSLFFALLLISVSVVSEPFTLESLVKLFLMLLFGAIGGIVGVNKKSRYKK
jgi:putative membrane protein (TIGR04086 family)